jgi:hypothetical protein
MSSITLHNLDDSLYMLLKKKAREQGTSLNRTIQEMLAESIGVKKQNGKGGKKDAYAKLCGALPPEELANLEAAEKEFEVIEDGDWQ